MKSKNTNPNQISSYIDIEDAAELTGFAKKHLRKLVKSGKITAYKNQDSIRILWSDVQQLASHQKPFWVALPDNALFSDAPDSKLLLYTDLDEEDVTYPAEYFYDRVENCNCIDWMRRMPPKIVQSVVTSPPYWGVRKYPDSQKITWADGMTTNLGEEPTVETYVGHTIEILRYLKQVLRDDGTIWWNMGDTYQTRAYLRESSTERLRAFEGNRNDLWSKYPNKRYSSGHSYLKDKDLTLVPFLVALAAEHIGFYVRSVVVWYKDNTLPEPTTDRPTTTHEYILLLAKSRFYKYDDKRVTEAAITNEVIKRINGKEGYLIGKERKLRTVWQFPTSSKHGNHTAAFPLDLPLRCLRLSTSKNDLVFDPFVGSGTTLAAAKLLGCHYAGCDIVEDFVKEAERRLLAPAEPLNGKKKTNGSSQKARSQKEKSTKVSSRAQPALLDSRGKYKS